MLQYKYYFCLITFQSVLCITFELIEVLFLSNFLCFHCLMNSRCRQLYHQWPPRTYIDYKAHATLKKLKKNQLWHRTDHLPTPVDIWTTTYLHTSSCKHSLGMPSTYWDSIIARPYCRYQLTYRVDFKFSDTLNVNLWLIGSY